MKIIKLHEDRDEWPRCGALLSRVTREFWRGRGRSQNKGGKDTCQCFAKYKIGEKYFCRKHAALYVLDNFDELIKGAST